MTTEIEEYKFTSFEKTPHKEGVERNYEFQDLEKVGKFSPEKKQETIKLERTRANVKQFKISPIVSKHRGMDDQLEEERQKQIADEVNRKVSAIQEQAHKEGFEEGVQQGREEVFNQTRLTAEEKLTSLTDMISHVLGEKGKIIQNQKEDLYSLIRTLSKWVILREVKEEDKYLERLLEKLVLEIQTKTNLLVKVDQKSFESMPEVLEVVQNKLGDLVNVRMEIDYDIEGPGIILESENCIIDGSLMEQFNGIDRLFESVGSLNKEENSVDQIMVDDNEEETDEGSE